ncbi:gas vesicle protein [Streptomyces platensis]|uniref:gas vesicle protein GvpO n=1 Tax=Streptomyces platensis TaxID=58346 RepID=UPI003681D81E
MFEPQGHPILYRQQRPPYFDRKPYDARRAEIMATEENTERGKAHGERPERISAPTAMRHAAGQLSQMLQCEPASVSALKPTDDGWLANVEVVEIERVPDTASVLATYRVHLDEQGQLVGYERTRRYGRGQIDR